MSAVGRPDHLAKLAKALVRAHKARKTAAIEFAVHEHDIKYDPKWSLDVAASKVRVEKLLDRLEFLVGGNP